MEDVEIARDNDRYDFAVRVDFRDRVTGCGRGRNSVTSKSETHRTTHPRAGIQNFFEKNIVDFNRCDRARPLISSRLDAPGEKMIDSYLLLGWSGCRSR